MARKKLMLLEKILEDKIADFEEKTKKSLESAIEVSKNAAASPSMSGDREHAVNQATINRERLGRLRELKDEVEACLPLKKPTKNHPEQYSNASKLLKLKKVPFSKDCLSYIEEEIL